MRYRQFQWNTNKDLDTPYSDMKRLAVSAIAEFLAVVVTASASCLFVNTTFARQHRLISM